MKKRFYLFAALLGITLPMMAAIELSSTSATYKQDFDGTATAEVLAVDEAALAAADAGKRSVSLAVDLPDGWKIRNGSNTSAIGVYETGAAATTYVGGTSLPANAKNGTWNLGKIASTDRAIGGITSSTSGGAQSINILCQVTNIDTEPITSLDLSYTIEQYRQGKKNYKMTLHTSATGTNGSWTTASEAFSLMFDNTVGTATGAEDALLPISSKSIEAQKLVVNIAPGASLYLAWHIAAADGREEGGAAALALDDVTIKANYGEELPDPDPIATEPAAAPEAPTYAAEKVRALYSATYSTDCNHGAWGGSQSFTKEAYGIKIVLNPGNGFVGLVDFPARDCSTMEKFHADVWVADNARMRFVPITGQAEQGVYADLIGGQWNSVEIALNEGDWARTTDWSNVYQLKIDYAPGLTFWINNVYFYTTQDLDIEKPVMTSATLASASYTYAVINVGATDNRGVTKYIVKHGDAKLGEFVPTDGKITVNGLIEATNYTLSIYAQDGEKNISDNKIDVELTTLTMPEAATAPNVTSKDYVSVYAPSLTNMLAHDFVLKNWGSADGVKNTTKGYFFYHTTNNAAVVWGENNAGGNAIVAADAYKGDKGGLDASAMEYMHVDIWADKAGCNSMVVVVNDHNLGAAHTLNAGWNSIDIPLSEFAAAPDNNYLLDNVAWIKFVGLNNTNDVAITNVYFWKAASDAPKQVSATVNDPAMGTAVVKQNDVEVTEAEIGSNVVFVAEANDGYLFLGWYKGSELQSTNATYTVENIQANTTLQAKFRALNNIYCHTELKTGDEAHTIYLTMKKTSENDYQIVIDTEEETTGFGGSYLGGYSETGDHQIQLNTTANMAKFVTISDNKHRITINVTSTTPLRWNTPIYMRYDGYPGDYAFAAPQGKTIEYDVTCAPVAVESVTLNQTEATVDVEGIVTLAAAASPIYADNQTVTWTSNNETVATVVNGVVTGHAEGNATITATIDGQSATCAITVALDPTVPHVAAPAVDATGKEIRAIYSDDVELAITNAEFGLNVYGNSPYEKKAIGGNNFLLYTATEAQQVISWGSSHGADNAMLAKDGLTNPEDAGAKGLYAADMKYLHIDIWSSAAATNFQIQNDNNIICMVNLDGSGWQSFDIDMTGKENNLKNISIMKFANTPRNTKVALDNLYFWKSNGTAPVTSVELNKTATTIDKGLTETLVATVLPDVANQNVTWKSSNEAVATVDATGKITAVEIGEATITATSEADDTKTASCVVTVVAPTTKTWYGYAEKNDLGFEYALTYNLDKTVTIVITRYGTKTGIVAPSFSIDGEWKDCVKDGDVWTRTTTKTFEAGVKYDCFIQNNYSGAAADPHFDYTVGSENSKPVIEVTGVKVVEDALTLVIGETSTLSATVLPMAATDKTITWSSDNEAVASVNATTGEVTAKTAGTANITATSTNGKTASCAVTVIASLEPATFWGEGAVEYIGSELQFIYSITRNADRTLTFTINTKGNNNELKQVNLHGDYNAMSLQNGAWTWTSTQTYAEGSTVTGFFYYPRYDFTYTVGSESERIAWGTTISENDNTSAMAEFGGTQIDVTLNRAFAAETLYTLCLPFGMDAAQIAEAFGAGTEVWKLVSSEDRGSLIHVDFGKVSTIEAGTPYLFKPASTFTSGTFIEGVGLVNTTGEDVNTAMVSMHGFVNATAYTGSEGYYFLGEDDYLHELQVAMTAPGLRAGFTFKEGAPVGVPARVFLGEQIATGIENAPAMNEIAEKVMIDGKLYIIRAERMYDAQGQLIR